nr:ABC-three component system middle component 1 [Enterococcus hulanensis]
MENGFETVPITTPFDDNVFFWCNYSETSTNFYLVIFTKEISEYFLTKQTPEYFNAIKTIEKGYDERIDKNLSMLICLKDRDIESTSKYKKIFEIEEDPYFFKKYLLSYNDDFDKIKNELVKGESINDTINNIINDVQIFNQYKDGKDIEEVKLYDVCTKLMTKIPFISLSHKQNDLDDLSETITSGLSEDNLMENRNKILEYFELEDEEFIDKMTESIELEDVDYE